MADLVFENQRETDPWPHDLWRLRQEMVQVAAVALCIVEACDLQATGGGSDVQRPEDNGGVKSG